MMLVKDDKIVLENIILQECDQLYHSTITINKGFISSIEKTLCTKNDITPEHYYITPGLVNSHFHPNQLFERGMLDNLDTPALLSGMHTQHNKTFADRYAQAQFTLLDAIRSGATSIYAVANSPSSVIAGFEQLQLSGAVACFFNDQWEGAGNPPKITPLKQIEAAFAKLYQHNTADLKIHIGTSSIHSASNDLLCLLNDIAKKYNTKVNLHISEGKASVASCIQHRGTTAIRLLQQLGVLNEHWNLIHATTIDLEEIKIIANSGATVIHCPVSNAKTGVGIAPLVDLKEHGITIALGTDACSNNNTNNILNEAYVAKLLHSGITHDPNIISDLELWQWITKNGHKIIGTPEHKFAVGQPADFLLWACNSSAFVPLGAGDLLSSILNNAPDLKPHTVFVKGKLVICDYAFVDISLQELQYTVNSRVKTLYKNTQETQPICV